MKRCAIIIFLLCALFISQSAHSQYVMQDVVLLKTAEVVRGDILENIPKEYVRIQMIDSIMREIDWKDIELITQEPKRNAKGKLIRDEFNQKSEKVKFGLIVDTGIAFGRQNAESAASLNFGLIPAVEFGGTVSIGLGSGLRVPINSESLVLPLNLDFRFSGSKRLGPILALGIGYGYLTETEFEEGGVMGYAKVGLKVRSDSGGAVCIFIGADSGPQLVNKPGFGFFGPSTFLAPQNVTGICLSIAFSF
jgi:hypothetical protein